MTGIEAQPASYFRALLLKDADKMAQLEAECFPRPWGREDFWREATSEHSCYVVALIGEEIIGYAGSWISFAEAQIINIALAPEYRGMGLSRPLMQAMIALVKRRGVTAMTLEVRPSNVPARRLYFGLGFQDNGMRRGYYEDGEDAVIMWHTNLADVVGEDIDIRENL